MLGMCTGHSIYDAVRWVQPILAPRLHWVEPGDVARYSPCRFHLWDYCTWWSSSRRHHHDWSSRSLVLIAFTAISIACYSILVSSQQMGWSSGNLRSFTCCATAARPLREDNGEMEEESPPTVHLPYAAGISEKIRRVYKDFNIRVVFMPGPTLCSLLTKVKDPPYKYKKLGGGTCRSRTHPTAL